MSFPLPLNCHLICKSVKHLITIRDMTVSMLSTIPDSYSKQADIHLTLSMRPYRQIPRSPLLVCYQMTDQHVGKWKDSDWKMFEAAATLKFLKL